MVRLTNGINFSLDGVLHQTHLFSKKVCQHFQGFSRHKIEMEFQENTWWSVSENVRNHKNWRCEKGRSRNWVHLSNVPRSCVSLKRKPEINKKCEYKIEKDDATATFENNRFVSYLKAFDGSSISSNKKQWENKTEKYMLSGHFCCQCFPLSFIVEHKRVWRLEFAVKDFWCHKADSLK